MLASSMHRVIRFVVPLLAVLPAFSREPIEGRFTAGVGGYVSDAQNLGYNGAGGSVRIYFSRRWSAEPEFWITRDNPERDYSILCNLSKDFVDRAHRVVPYGFWVLGFTHEVTHYSSPAHVAHSNYPALGVGLGTRIFLSDRVFVAPQVRLSMIGRSGELTGSIGFVLRKGSR
jgi:hypothetical protein